MMWNKTPYVLIVCIVIIFKIKDASQKYPAKIFVRRSILHRRNIYRSIITEGNLTSPQILDHKDDRVSFSLLFVCFKQNTLTNCQCVGSQFNASKMQETHSRGNTGLHLYEKHVCLRSTPEKWENQEVMIICQVT